VVTVIGKFDCVGENLGITLEQRTRMLNGLPSNKKKEAEEAQKLSKGRPNSEDLENAKKFARSLIKKL